MSDEQTPKLHPVVMVPAILGCGACGNLMVNPTAMEPLNHETATVDMFCPKCDVTVCITVPRVEFPVVGQASRIAQSMVGASQLDALLKGRKPS